MNVGDRGDCLAMDIVEGGESVLLTAHANRHIRILAYCFTRYAISITISDQSSESVINAVIGNYITVNGTPRRIQTDQGMCFKSALFKSFCNIFCIHNVRTQVNGLNQTKSAGGLTKLSSIYYVICFINLYMLIKTS